MRFGIAALALALLALPSGGTASGARMASPAAGGKALTDQSAYRPAGHSGCGPITADRDAVKIQPADYRGPAPGLFTPARHCLRRGPWSGPDLSSRRISST